MILHCTKKLAARLPSVPAEPLEETSPLGSWHANLLHIDRRQCLFLCHDESRAVLFLPGVRKEHLLDLDKLFQTLLASTLQALGCKAVSLPKLKLALGPMRFDSVTDRSVLASMTVATGDLYGRVNRVQNVLELDPVAVSAYVSQRPATIRKKWIRPDKLLLQRFDGLSI
ncbi:MAG: hypothetical protein WBN40_03435 [Pseudomonadales bacterium]